MKERLADGLAQIEREKEAREAKFAAYQKSQTETTDKIENS